MFSKFFMIPHVLNILTNGRSLGKESAKYAVEHRKGMGIGVGLINISKVLWRIWHLIKV